MGEPIEMRTSNMAQLRLDLVETSPLHRPWVKGSIALPDLACTASSNQTSSILSVLPTCDLKLYGLSFFRVLRSLSRLFPPSNRFEGRQQEDETQACSEYVRWPIQKDRQEDHRGQASRSDRFLLHDLWA